MGYSDVSKRNNPCHRVDERDGCYLLYTMLIAQSSPSLVDVGKKTTSTSRWRGEDEAMKGSQGDGLVVHPQSDS